MPTGPPPREAVVVRLNPIDPERVLNKAIQEFRRIGHHGLSVFVVAPGDHGEEWAAQRAYDAALLQLKPPTKYHVTTVGNLLDRGFVFMKDQEHGTDDPNEAEEHYCVSLGDEPDLADVERFLEAFSERKPA